MNDLTQWDLTVKKKKHYSVLLLVACRPAKLKKTAEKCHLLFTSASLSVSNVVNAHVINIFRLSILSTWTDIKDKVKKVGCVKAIGVKDICFYKVLSFSNFEILE